MGWSLGYDNNRKRDIGYGVPAVCDQPKCEKEIDRGLGYVCGGEPYGGEKGCGLYFCGEHQVGRWQRCKRCDTYRPPYKPKPDALKWVRFKLKDMSWLRWRDKHPEEVREMVQRLRASHN